MDNLRAIKLQTNYVVTYFNSVLCGIGGKVFGQDFGTFITKVCVRVPLNFAMALSFFVCNKYSANKYIELLCEDPF